MVSFAFRAPVLCALSVVALFFLAPHSGPAEAGRKPVIPPAPEDPLAAAFGSMPALYGVRLSPDGSKVSFLIQDRKDLPALVVHDFTTGKSAAIMNSLPGQADIDWCDWANTQRLLCGYRGMINYGHGIFPVTKLVAVNADGSAMRVLMNNTLTDHITQFQDRIVDYLVDDPDHVLVQLYDGTTSSTARLNINDSSIDQKTQPLVNVWEYVSDGHGKPRLYFYEDEKKYMWAYRMPGQTDWTTLHETEIQEGVQTAWNYQPLGFGDDLTKLLVLKPHEGRMALWSEDLADGRKQTLLFAHPEVDVGGVLTLGKYNRPVAVSYSTDRSHLEFFDKDIARITAAVEAAFPDQHVSVFDESWDRRYYLLSVSSDRNPGTIYRLDRQRSEIVPLMSRYPDLAARTLSRMNAIRFTARDGVKVTGYLTRPQGDRQIALPLVVMPHGGPQSRDYWGFDWLAQYFAAKGYAVLQVNYRGSGGFGTDWAGEGGFKAWQQAVNDITDAVQASVKGGIADPARICMVGWSYGGYAALMSGIEHPELYRCLVSIAGVTDLQALRRDKRRFVGGKAYGSFIGDEEAVIKDGSPVRRAAEIRAPVLLFHGTKDLNVQIKHSEKMSDALKSAGKAHEFYRYEGGEHSLERTGWRVDMLSRIGAFLDANTGSGASSTAGGN